MEPTNMPEQFDLQPEATSAQITSDELVREIGREIVGGSKFNVRPWEQIVVVAEIGNRRRLFGYVYWGEDRWEAATPDGFRALALYGELREAMLADGAEPWKKCLTRIDRSTGRVDMDFDESGERWTPDPSDAERFVRSLR